MNLEELKAESAKLKTVFATIQEKTKKVKADAGDPSQMDMQDMCDMVDNCNASINALYSYASRIEDALYTHSGTGHLPKLTPTQMNAALKMCKADGDFQCYPKSIYASTLKQGANHTLEVTMDIKK